MEIHLLQITKIKLETEESKTFFLVPIDGKAFNYKAGQFLTLVIQINGNEVRRSYSFSSTPGVDDSLFITIKRVQNGAISRYIFDHLKEGDTIQTLSPAGRFTLPAEPISQHFFVAAGSGITPVYSLVKEVLYKQDDSSITLIYQNPNEAKSIFRNSLLELKKVFANRFEFIEIFSHPSSHNFFPQRLNNTLLEALVKKHVHANSVQFYLCGPKEFMRMAQFTLRVMGYENAQISKENFVVDFVPPPAFIMDTSPKKVTVRIHNNEHTFSVAYPQNILQAALQNHIMLPYSCRGGRCSTCTAKCVSGSVKMSINDVLTEKDLAEGLVLTCVGYAETDIELEF